MEMTDGIQTFNTLIWYSCCMKKWQNLIGWLVFTSTDHSRAKIGLNMSFHVLKMRIISSFAPKMDCEYSRRIILSLI